jgi:hypothetical protein
MVGFEAGSWIQYLKLDCTTVTEMRIYGITCLMRLCMLQFPEMMSKPTV